MGHVPPRCGRHAPATDWPGSASAEGGRAELTFDHPNMAANYFLISLFVVVLSRSPRNRLGRVAACAALLGALVVTGSNAALLGLPLAAGIAGYVAIRRVLRLRGGAGGRADHRAGGRRRRRGRPAAGDGAHQPERQQVRAVLRRRAARGAPAARQELFAQEYELFRTGSLLGRGPASTRETLGSSTAPTAKEAHDDYLATLVERGALGVVGLMLLIGAIVIRAISIDPRRLSAEFRRVVPSTAPLVGALVAMAVAAFTHEILHYRHFWALLGILAAIHLLRQGTRSRRPPSGREPRNDRARDRRRRLRRVSPLRGAARSRACGSRESTASPTTTHASGSARTSSPCWDAQGFQFTEGDLQDVELGALLDDVDRRVPPRGPAGCARRHGARTSGTTCGRTSRSRSGCSKRSSPDRSASSSTRPAPRCTATRSAIRRPSRSGPPRSLPTV